MKIEIQEADGDLKTIRVPLWIVPSRLIGKFVVKSQSKELVSGKEFYSNPANFIRGDEAKIVAFLKVVKQFAKTHPDWVLVECEEEDGENIKITL